MFTNYLAMSYMPVEILSAVEALAVVVAAAVSAGVAAAVVVVAAGVAAAVIVGLRANGCEGVWVREYVGVVGVMGAQL